MVAQVAVAIAADPRACSSLVRVPRALAPRLHVREGTYVRLRASAPSSARVFRVIVPDAVDVADAELVIVDHWPSISSSGSPTTGTATTPGPGDTIKNVAVELVAPAFVDVAQFVELRPAELDQPPLSPAMAKVLLRNHVLHGHSGSLRLLHQGIDYGKWEFEAFYRGVKRRKRHSNTVGDDRGTEGEHVGVVNDETMLMLMPFSLARRRDATAGDTVTISHALQPMGLHGRKLRDLASIALFPPTPVDDQQLGEVMQPRSILLHGPSGCGKSTLVGQVAEELGVHVLNLDCTLLATPHFRIEDIFTAALRVQPALIVIEDLELIFPRALDETKYKLICRFVACLERTRTSRIAAIGIVSSINALNTKIRQVFEEEVTLEVPDKAWSVRLLELQLPSCVQLEDAAKQAVAVKFGQRPSNIVSIVSRLTTETPDLAQMTPDAVWERLERYGRELAGGGSSSLRSSIPNVTWDDIGGQAVVKQSLIEMVVWPLEKPDVFLRMGISPPQGMLLHGPPGTGKTMLAKASARASGCNFLNVLASDLLKAEFGESEKAVTRVFDTARALSPCMVFIDEFQSLFGNRTTAGVTTSRMISQLLMELDSLKAVADDERRYPDSSTASLGDRVFVLAATNALSAIDPAFLQPGRFENILHVGLPVKEERQAILDLQRARMPWHKNVDVEALADATAGANAAAVVALCQAAAIKAMQRENATQEIEMIDFHEALAAGQFQLEA